MVEELNESLKWKDVFRRGLAPQLTSDELETLLTALVNNDPDLIQGKTVEPCGAGVKGDEKPKAGCMIGYIIWKCRGANEVRDVQNEFACICCGIDVRLAVLSVNRYLLNFFDETPRDKMRPQLIEEIELELERRKKVAHEQA